MSEALIDPGIPPLRPGAGMSGKLRIMVLAFVVLFFLVVFGVVVYGKFKSAAADAKQEEVPEGKLENENQDTDVKAPPTYVSGALNSRAGATPAAPADSSADAAAPASPSGGGLSAPPAIAGGAAAGELSEAEKAEADHQARRQHAPVLAFSRTAPAAANNQSQGGAEAKSAEDPYEAMMKAALSASTNAEAPAPPAPQPSGLSQQLRSDALTPALATRSTNRSFLVEQGTMGRCTLRTAFNSQLSGFASCILSDPLFSADGRFVMAEAGSEAIGQYQTGQVKPGVSRAFVLWTSIKTPHGVRISLDSPATDGMGQSGITGRVNNHFWKRYGSGLLLSIVDDAATQVTRNSPDYRQTGQSVNEAASIAVQSNVDIPPTITVKPGAVVNIFVARDLDFSSVYSARLSDAAAND